MKFVAQRIDHVEVLVRDLEASARWYRETLGLEEVARWDPEPVMIAAGDTKLALFKATEEGKNPDPVGEGKAHWHLVAFLTDAAGFAVAQEHLLSLSIPFRGPVDHDLSWSIYFEDPDGNPLEITYYL